MRAMHRSAERRRSSVMRGILDMAHRSTRIEDRVTEIQIAVCTYYGITIEELLSNERTERVAWPRMVAMYLATSVRISEAWLGNLFKRGRATVFHAIKAVSDRLDTEDSAREQLTSIRGKLGLQDWKPGAANGAESSPWLETLSRPAFQIAPPSTPAPTSAPAWITDQLPDSGMTVLMRYNGPEYLVWPGFHDGETWRSADGSTVEGPVLGWMELEDAARALDGGKRQ